jgi:hypothetical protein
MLNKKWELVFFIGKQYSFLSPVVSPIISIRFFDFIPIFLSNSQAFLLLCVTVLAHCIQVSCYKPATEEAN